MKTPVQQLGTEMAKSSTLMAWASSQTAESHLTRVARTGIVWRLEATQGRQSCVVVRSPVSGNAFEDALLCLCILVKQPTQE